MATRSRSVNYCFTVNNYTDEDIQKLKKMTFVYLVIGFEIGDKKTPHIQGFIHYKNPRDFNSVRKDMKWHIEKCKGTAQQNIDYCKKDGVFEEYGIAPINKGKRNDLNDIKARILGGENIGAVARTCDNYQQIKYAETLSKYISVVLTYHKKEIYWLWGNSGCGKTKFAASECDISDTWISGKNLKWFDGYFGQKDVIIDDFRSDFCPFNEILRILDGYPLRVENKGGSCMFTPKRIFITSCYSPENVYNTIEDKSQLLRRIDFSCYFP